MTAEEILKNVRIALGFKTKAEFARSIHRRVDTLDYAIKNNVITSTTELLITTYNPTVRAEYLRTGEGDILKAPTENLESLTNTELIRIIRMQASKLDELRIQSENNKKKGISKLRLAYFKMFIHYQKLNKSLSN